MPNFLLYEPIHKAGLAVLNKAGNVRLASATDEDTIIAEIADIDGVVIRAQGAMTRRILENAPRLKVVGRHGVGVDNIDLEAATDHGVQVVNTPTATVEGVAEHVLGMIVTLSKKILSGHKRLVDGDWSARYELRGRELKGRTLGVIGFGRIGRRIAQICHYGLNMSILYSDVLAAPDLEKALGAKKVEMDNLLQTADYVTVHVPLLPSTRGLIGKREFSLMRPDTLFFNASRGPVVDEKALYEALVEGQIAGAGLDVFEQEPTPADNPLLKLEQIIVTPHMATATQEALIAMSMVTTDIVAAIEGRQPEHPVNQV